MALIECKPSQPGVESRWVEIDCITADEVARIRQHLDEQLRSGQVSDAVALAFVEAVTLCPTSNPSDLWHHIIYRYLLEIGWSDQRWKRVSGFALERALVAILNPELDKRNIRLRILSATEATELLRILGLAGTKASKVDLFIEGNDGTDWRVFGAAHVKSSIAERIQDDVPASLAFMEKGLLSIALTMDAKSYPPPHGNCINYGELGGRSVGVEKDRLKRGYVEIMGQFDALFSFNSRTPPSPDVTPSGKRIYTVELDPASSKPLIQFLDDRWRAHPKSIEV